MLKKLRFKFILINMSIVSIMLIGVVFLFNLRLSYLRYNKSGMLHSIPNRINSIMMFILPFLFFSAGEWLVSVTLVAGLVMNLFNALLLIRK